MAAHTDNAVTIEAPLEFVWERGRAVRMPDVWHHNELRDFVCNARTFDFLHQHVNGDLHVVARGRLGTDPLVLVQVIDVRDVVAG